MRVFLARRLSRSRFFLSRVGLAEQSLILDNLLFATSDGVVAFNLSSKAINHACNGRFFAIHLASLEFVDCGNDASEKFYVRSCSVFARNNDALGTSDRRRRQLRAGRTRSRYVWVLNL